MVIFNNIVIGSIKGSDDDKKTINKRSTGSYIANAVGTFAAGDHGKIFKDWNATCPDGSQTPSNYFYLSVNGELTFSYSLRLSESKGLSNLEKLKVYCNGTGYIDTSG